MENKDREYGCGVLQCEDRQQACRIVNWAVFLGLIADRYESKVMVWTR
jgi:hypothetical protein